MNERITAFVRERRDELVALVRDLVAARTENPPGEEHRAAEVAARYLTARGIPFRTYEARPGRTNLIGVVGRGRPRIVIAAHLDVVPAGDGWQTDPFQAVERDGYLYGRGVCDNKGAAAAMLLAGSFLKNIERDLPGEVWLAGVADEECGSRLGLGWLVEQGVLKDTDYALVPDVSEQLRLIDVAEKGAFFFRLVSHGKQAHGSRPEDGVNAIWNLIALLERLRAMPLPGRPHPLLTPPTLNLGQIQGGSAPNMVPATCSASVDIRYLPGTTESEIRTFVEGAIAETARETGGRFEFEVLTSHAPTEVPADHPLVAAARSACETVLGEPVRVGGMSGATVVKQLLLAGIPAVGLGAGEPHMAHAANERIEIAQLQALARVLVLAPLKLMGQA